MDKRYVKKNYSDKSPHEKFHNQFKFILPGYNLEPNELNGVVGSVQLRKLPTFLKVRRENSNLFKSLLSDKSYCKIQKCDHDSSWYGFSLILDGSLSEKESSYQSIIY